MWYGPDLSDDELNEMTQSADRLARAVGELRQLRKELAAFEGVRRYLKPEAITNPADA